MALLPQEQLFVKEVVLHGDKHRAIKEAIPLLSAEYIGEGIEYMMQNPEVQRHIDAGILYIYKEVIPDVKIEEPAPLSFKDKEAMLQLIIAGARKMIRYIKRANSLEIILTPPDDQEIATAKETLELLRKTEAANDNLAA